jgi:hypothetical protein
MRGKPEHFDVPRNGRKGGIGAVQPHFGLNLFWYVG